VLRRLQFDLWYVFRAPWDSGISPPELLDYMTTHPAGRAIDLGCGSGTNVITLASQGWKVTGIDYAPRTIRIARRKLRKAGLQATLAIVDVCRMDSIDGPFDLALDLGCFHGLQDRAGYLRNLKRVLNPGGHWLLYGFLNPGRATAGRGLSESDLALLASSGLRLLSRKDGLDKRGWASAWFLFQNDASMSAGNGEPQLADS
jgi:SAM-dependent methyltransferase